MRIVKKVLTILVSVAAVITMTACSSENSSGGGGTASEPAFITTWKTDNPGFSGTDQILISTNNGGGNFTIDWGDGLIDENLSNDNTHTYGSAGTYTVKITGDFPRIFFNNLNYDAAKLLSVENWGDISWTTMEKAFFECSNLVVNATDLPNLSNVTNMSGMFSGASVFNSDISAWDTSAVTNMSWMFDGAYAFNSDISAWNTSAVTDMSGVFEFTAAFNGDISAWDTSAVTNMRFMFNGASAFNGDISAWDTSAVTNMSYMFQNAVAFADHNLSGWNVSSTPTHLDFLTGAGTGNIEPIW